VTTGAEPAAESVAGPPVGGGEAGAGSETGVGPPVGSVAEDGSEAAGAGQASEPQRLSRRVTVVQMIERLIVAIRNGDDAMVEKAVLSLSQRSRWLAPLALVVGAFVMLFQGLKLLVTNWRLTLVQILPAMWIWAAMLDLKVHVFRGKQLRIVTGPVLIPILLGIIAITVASFYLNAVFAFAISKGGTPDIRRGFSLARAHLRAILYWGCVTGLGLGFAACVSQRLGKGWFVISLSIVVGVMMLAYVAVPARLVGVKSNRSPRDKVTAAAVGGAIGAMVCSPPYALGRLAIILLGSHTFRVLAIFLLVVAIILQTGATSATKAIKFSAKLVTGHGPGAADPANSADSAAQLAAVEATAAQGPDPLSGADGVGPVGEKG
jgi:hypothetical protein